ncbi:MAG TPA: hypothetical protein VGD14_22980 [bacterium]
MNRDRSKLVAYLMAAILAIGLLAPGSFAQKKFEGYWEQQTVRKSTMPMQPKEAKENEKTFYKSGKMKMMNLTTGRTTIFRFDKELVWTVDEKKKAYEEMTFAQMQEGMDQMRSEMKKEMKGMSAEEREMMEKMMGKKMGGLSDEGGEFEITVNRSGKKNKILDYNCEQVFLLLNNEPLMEMWVTDKFNLGTEFLDVYQKMGFMKGKLSDEAKKIRGIPLLTKMSMNMGMGKIDSESQVTKVVETSVSDSEFEVPGGYTKQKSQVRFNK